MKRLTSLLLPLLFVPALLAAQTTVTGTVTTGAGGKAVPAHVHLYPFKGEIGMEPISTTEVGKDGKYSVTISGPGLYRLIVTAVNHDYLSVPVAVEEGKHSVRLDMVPPLLNYKTAPEEVAIIGSWNDFDFQSAEPMKREKDGTFTYTLKTDEKELHYQLLGIAEGAEAGMRSVNAPGSEGYVYDGGGDYRSIIKVKPGTVTIRFNPAALPVTPTENEGEANFAEPQRQKLWDIDVLYTRKMRRFRQAAIAARENGTPFDMKGIWGPFLDEMVKTMNDGSDPASRRYAALYAARLMQFSNASYSFLDDNTLATVRNLLPLDSPLWSAEPAIPTALVVVGAEDQDAAIREVVAASPDRKVRGIALSHGAMNAFYSGDKEKAMEYYRTLKADYSDIEEVDYVLMQLNPDKRVQSGKEVPDFEVALVGAGEANGSAAGGTVSRESMKGKYYLIDFWATWCGPCIGEMGELHAAYEKFGGKDFEILSISFDAAPEDITKFRGAKWKMPWLHAFATGNFNSDLARAFEVSGIPKPVLVDPDGMIVATEGELRGKNLDATLERYLGDGQAAQ